jgi:hypothetical protein
MMFRRITADVNEQTRGRQRPETYISLLNEYYLNQSDSLAWERVKESTDIAALRQFVTRFPSSVRALDARYRLDLLERLAGERKAEQLENARRRADEDAARQREAEERAKQGEAARARQQAEQEAERQRIARREEEERAAKALEARRLGEEDAARRRQADQEAERQKTAREAALQAQQQASKLAEERRLDEERRRSEQEKAAAEAAEAKRLAERARLLAEQEMARTQETAKPVTPNIVRETQIAASANAEARPQTGDHASFTVASVQPDMDTPAPRKPGAIAIDPILEIQLELSRIGCLTGRASGQLDAATKSAVRNYLSHAHGPSDVAINADLLNRLRTHQEPVCPIQCAKGQVADGDHCVASREQPAPQRAKPARAPKPQIAARPDVPRVRREPAPASPPPSQPSAFKSATSPGRPIVGVGF